MSTAVGVTLAIINALTFSIALCLFLRSMYKKRWFEKEVPATVRISLFIDVACYLLTTLLAFLFYLFVCVFGYNSSEQDPRDHAAVTPIYYLLLSIYLISIMLNTYVWIQRLQHIYTNSVYGVSSSFMRCLKFAYLAIIIVALLLFALYLFNDSEADDDAVRSVIRALVAVFALLFVGESLTVTVAFVYKLQSMQSVLRRFPDNDMDSLLFVQELLAVQMKMTVLVCVQVVSTVIAVALPMVLDAEATVAGITVDAFVGYMCVYCTLAEHDAVFEKSCFLCIGCCALCIERPPKMHMHSSERTRDDMITEMELKPDASDVHSDS